MRKLWVKVKTERLLLIIIVGKKDSRGGGIDDELK